MSGRPFDFYQKTIHKPGKAPQTTYHGRAPECVGDIGANEIVIIDDNEYWSISPAYTLNKFYSNREPVFREVYTKARQRDVDLADTDFDEWEIEGETYQIKHPSPIKRKLLRFLWDRHEDAPDGFSSSELRQFKVLGTEARIREMLGEAYHVPTNQPQSVVDLIVCSSGTTANKRYYINPEATPAKFFDPDLSSDNGQA